jgi:hypothetical protein
MKAPKFTDLHRFFYRLYTPANATDIRKTFEEVRRIREEAKERERLEQKLRSVISIKKGSR